MSSDKRQTIQQQVQAAYASSQPLCIQAGNSKSFYGRIVEAEPLSMAEHSGILSYEPTELVIRARAGTRLTEIEAALEEKQQMLAFEPPHFATTASVGGTLAAGLSGPRRAYAGAVRDHVLGISCINGKGEYLQFGGQVMKNVAGYDVSRLFASSLGTLGVILDVSLKVIPKPEYETTLCIQCEQEDALSAMQRFYLQALPISASLFYQDNLYIRLSGMQATVQAAIKTVAEGKEIDNSIWRLLKEHQHECFQQDKKLFRFSVPANTSVNFINADVIEWGGALRWLYSDEDFSSLQKLAIKAGGSVSRFYQLTQADEYFQPLDQGIQRLHENLKQAFDPKHILNPKRMYAYL